VPRKAHAFSGRGTHLSKSGGIALTPPQRCFPFLMLSARPSGRTMAMVFLLLACSLLALGVMAHKCPPLTPGVRCRWLASTIMWTGGPMASALAKSLARTTMTVSLFAASTVPITAQQLVTITFTFQVPSHQAVAPGLHSPGLWTGQHPAFASGLEPWRLSPGVWESTSPMMAPACGLSPGGAQHQTYQQYFMGQQGRFPLLNGHRYQPTPGFAVQTSRQR